MDEFSLDQFIAEARAITLAQGFHLPTVLVHGTRGDGIIVIADMPNTHEERAQALYQLGYAVSREPIGQLRNVVLVLESWYSRAKPGQTEMTIRPSEDPEREEMLLFDHFIVRGGIEQFVSLTFVRNDRGELISLIPGYDSRSIHAAFEFESPLMRAFMRGFGNGRKGRIPPVSGAQG